MVDKLSKRINEGMNESFGEKLPEKLSESLDEMFLVVPGIFKELGQGKPWDRGIKSKDWRYASSKLDESMLHACFKFASEELKFVAGSMS